MYIRISSHKRLLGALSLVISFALSLSTAQAAGQVEAQAGNVTDGPNVSTAVANDGAWQASANRTAVLAQGAVSLYTQPYTYINAKASSNFTVEGLIGAVPLTFHWAFTGSRTWNADNAVFNGGLGATLSAPGMIDTISWGISYVDFAAPFGDFAGTLSNPFGVSAAGSGFLNDLPAGSWNGQGSRAATATILTASTGLTGSFEIQSQFNFTGEMVASYGLQLAAVTVQSASQLAPGAHLQLDNGSQIAITAVPEPETAAMLLAGLALVGWRTRVKSRVQLPTT